MLATHQDAIGAAEISDLITLACRAPSLHNSQPWNWEIDGTTLHLFAFPDRFDRRTMATDHEVLLSCGAALDHLQVAAVAAGWSSTVVRYPDTRNHHHLASTTFHRAERVSDHARVLGKAIGLRRTDRLAFDAPEPWDDIANLLESIVNASVAHLDIVDDSGRPALAEASRRCEDERRLQDDTYDTELEWWTGYFGVADAIPSTAIPSTSEAAHVDVARAFPTYGFGDARPKIRRDRSKILVLSTYDDSRDVVLRCGEILSRVLLECTAFGLATCTLTHMIERHAAREDIRRITGCRGEPQVLVRVGRAPAVEPSPPPTPRFPLSTVLRIR
jgi:nitroreductase